MPTLDFSAIQVPLIFDQGSYFQIQMTPRDKSGNVVPYATHGMRMWFFVDASAVLLLLTVGSGIVVADTSPTIVVTIQATDTTSASPMNGVATGRWNLYDDPNGTEDAFSSKIAGGSFFMNLLGPAT